MKPHLMPELPDINLSNDEVEAIHDAYSKGVKRLKNGCNIYHLRRKANNFRIDNLYFAYLIESLHKKGLIYTTVDMIDYRPSTVLHNDFRLTKLGIKYGKIFYIMRKV